MANVRAARARTADRAQDHLTLPVDAITEIESTIKEENLSADKNQNVLGGIIVLLVVVGVVWYNFGGGMEEHAASTMQQIERQVADDAVQQYDIAKRNGTAADAYVQAGMVAAAYLQAKDEANYRKWKSIQKQEAKRAGIPAD